ncbi:uncharacterized protein TNCV_1955751 [Trichonephila clavipes]|nr:uncharacterized protein TNCV_1955751 [Trichonephila clavipes]
MSANPYDVLERKLECIGLIQMSVGTRLLDLKSKTEKKSYAMGKAKVVLTDSIISKIQSYYRMAIRNNINDLHSMKTAVWAVYFHLLSSNESPQHERCHAIINTWCKFQKIEAECYEWHCVINTYTRAIYHNELNEAIFYRSR